MNFPFDYIDVAAWLVVTTIMTIWMLSAHAVVRAFNKGIPLGDDIYKHIHDGSVYEDIKLTTCVLMTCAVVMMPVFNKGPLLEDAPLLVLLYVPTLYYMIKTCIYDIKQLLEFNIPYLCYLWLTGRLIYGILQGTI